MKNADAIPTSKVPVLHVKCYHVCAVNLFRHSTDAIPNHHGHTRFELVDPDEDAKKLLRAWLAEEDEQYRGTLRHLVIEDRYGVHRYNAQRRGTSSIGYEGMFAFDAYTDYDSVLPNPGVREQEEVPETAVM
jgi:hypothetical protein